MESAARRWGAGALTLALVAGCTGAPPDRPAARDVLLYTSMPEAVVEQLEGVVEQRFPDMDGDFWVPIDSEGISLTVVRGRTADIEQQIAEELDTGGIRADMIWLAEPSPYEVYKDLGILMPYAPAAGGAIPAEYIDPDGFYVAARVISMVIAWNTSLWPGGLADWPDFARAGGTAFPAPESGASRATIKALMDRYGPEYFATLSLRGGVSVSSNETARDGLTQGAFGAVAVLDYMAREARNGSETVDFAYPASGTVLIPSPIAITANAHDPAAAVAVADFILSRAGQQIIVEIGGFYPVRTDVAPPPGSPPLETIPRLEIDWSELNAAIGPIAAMWDELFGPESAQPSGS